MNLELFSSPEYNMSRKWEFNVVVKDEMLTALDNIEDGIAFIEKTDFNFYAVK